VSVSAEHVEAGQSLTVTLQLSGDADSTPCATWSGPGGGVGDAGPPQHPETGRYTLALASDAPGEHVLRWVAVVDSLTVVQVDQWSVVDRPGIVSLDAVKNHLRISGTGDDDQLRATIDAVSDLCESLTGRLWRRTALTDVLDGPAGPQLVLPCRPVSAVSSVIESGRRLGPEGYVLDGPAGILWRGTPSAPRCWDIGWKNVTVTYTAGPLDGAVPSRIRRGCLEACVAAWARQRGGSNLPRLEEFAAGPVFPLPLSVTNRQGTGYWDGDSAGGFA
jgi:hypothetical protein